MAVEDWSTTAASNSSLGTIALGENAMSVDDINDFAREMMAQIATWRDGAIAGLGDSADYQPLDATLTALAAVTSAADKGLYFTGSDAPATYDLTAFGRTLAALADVAALRTLLGAVTITAASIASTGYIKFDISGTPFTIQWGSQSVGGNAQTNISYPTSFSSFSRPVVSGAAATTNAQDNAPGVRSAGLTSFSVINAINSSVTVWWIAVGS